ncbi:hypothetical protein BDV23DRAFT_193010 [Aspergillus alliaceus]|uniref:Uncharacterized protein n=1 Tax=Petromyces alliaceus TaxID=209559 RepID=A0A5N7CRG6_PETAA|nr:hypothetical protein BDV23DRAFT_193010 [Aspergillus alliaceus]
MHKTDHRLVYIIRTFLKDKGNDVMDKLFLTDEPNFKDVHNFFREVNDNIRAANMVHGTEGVRVGEILAHTYEVMYQSWKMELAKPEVENNPGEAWKAYDKNISASAAEQAFGPRLSSEVPVTPISQGESSDLESSGDEGSETGSEDEDQSGDDYTPSAIDLLEARAWKEERSLTGAKVLFWWSKGTGTQFVRYGSKSKPIFRIRAGSHEYYDKKRVTRVLSSQNRGYMKRPEVIDGIPGETWKYGRRDVFNILGDGEITLETGAFVRRIANGSILDGDRLVYQKAKELEEAYREDNRAADLGDDADEASESSGYTAITRASKKSSLGSTAASCGVKARAPVIYDDPRDREIRRLKEQVERLSMKQPWQQSKQVQSQPANWNSYPSPNNMYNGWFDDRASTVSSKPPIRPLRRSRRRRKAYSQEPWNYWTDGSWNHNANTYY